MTIRFIKALELRQLSIGFVFLLKPRVSEKQLIVDPGIFAIELDAASQ